MPEPRAEVRSAEGVVTFMRSERRPERPCMCCPDGKGHVFARHLVGDFGPDEPGTHGKRPAGPVDWLYRQMRTLPEGSTVRLSVEVVSGGAPPTESEPRAAMYARGDAR